MNKSRPNDQQRYRDKQIAAGLVQFNKWVTEEEKAVLIEVLAAHRNGLQVFTQTVNAKFDDFVKEK